MADRLLTTEELAERLGVPAKWPLQQARVGNIPHVRLVRYVRFELADVEAWLLHACHGAHIVAAAVHRPTSLTRRGLPVGMPGDGQRGAGGPRRRP
jgi:excisionase family DNA binding protein